MANTNEGFPRGPEYSEGEIFDVAIIGAGPAGLTAATYTARSMLKTLVLEKMGAGGQAALTDEIENYPGFPEGINGYELAMKMDQQAKRFGIKDEFATVEKITRDEKTGIFTIETDGQTYKSKTVIVTTGVSPRKMEVPGEEGFIGRGISFCATCDGAFYREKIAAVIGGGDSAVEEAAFLTKFAEKVYIIHRRDALRAVKSVQQKAFSNEKIEIVWDSIVTEVIGDDSVQKIKVKNVKDNSIKELDVDGIFIYIGGIANTGFAPDEIKDDKGYILTDEKMKTSVPGLFSAGDCRVKEFRQVATAVGDGALAAYHAEKYIEDNFHQ